MTTKDSTLRLDKELGVLEKIVPTTIPKIIPNTVEVGEDDIEDDYKYQRDNFYNLVEKVQLRLMEYWNSQKKVSIQEHMKLLDN